MKLFHRILRYKKGQQSVDYEHDGKITIPSQLHIQALDPPTRMHTSRSETDLLYSPPGIEISHNRKCILLGVSTDVPAEMDREVWAISDYNVLQRIHKGAHTKVYICQCSHSKMNVVVKIIKCKDSEVLRRHALREIKNQMRLQHPNIVKLYAAFEENGNFVLIQEYVPCVNLSELLQSRNKAIGRCTENDVCTLFLTPILSALAYLHDNSICHRDIKLENVLFTEDGCIKICDFGVSIDLANECATTRCGTDGYMAPEVSSCPLKAHWGQYKECSTLYYGLHADIWSIGVLAYELCVGITPYIDIRHEPRVRFPSTMSRLMVDFITACLNRSPTLRPSAHTLQYIIQYIHCELFRTQVRTLN